MQGRTLSQTRKEKRKCSHEKLKHELDLKEWSGKNRVTKFSEMQTEWEYVVFKGGVACKQLW